jgi:hypothetical protein
MVIILLLLAPLMVISNLLTFIVDPTLSFRCAWDQISTYDSERTISFALLAASILILTVGGYASSIMAIYSDPCRASSLGGEEKDNLKREIMRRNRRRRQQHRENNSPHHRDQSRHHGDNRSRHHRDHRRNQPRHFYIPWRRILVPLIDGLHKSFFWQLSRLAFYFTFGITNLVTAWIAVSPAKRWSTSFGQIMPLILLVTTLPPVFEV